MQYLILISFLILNSSAWASDAAAMFEQKFQAIRTMQANFLQTVYAKHESSHSSGKMALMRPGRFRWSTQSPMKQLIIADGNRLWIYDEDLEQVTIKKQSQAIEHSAGLFLSDRINHLLSSYEVTLKTTGTTEVYDLRSKSSHSDFKHVLFTFEGSQLQGLELADTLGQRTVVKFKQIKMNSPIAIQLFKFSPPKGVDVIDEGDPRG